MARSSVPNSYGVTHGRGLLDRWTERWPRGAWSCGLVSPTHAALPSRAWLLARPGRPIECPYSLPASAILQGNNHVGKYTLICWAHRVCQCIPDIPCRSTLAHLHTIVRAFGYVVDPFDEATYLLYHFAIVGIKFGHNQTEQSPSLHPVPTNEKCEIA